ncbi:MAG: CPBP family intramembrane glutamic endopeptidase [Deltaproteobacteria bacterium]
MPSSRRAALGSFAVILVATLVLAAAVIDRLVAPGLEHSLSPRSTIVWAVLAGIGLGLPWLVLVRWKKQPAASVGLSFSRRTLAHAMIGCAVGAAMALAVAGLGAAISAVGLRDVQGGAPAPGAVAVAFGAFLLSAVFQQGMTLAGLVGSLRVALPSWMAVAIPALVFALAHLLQPNAGLVSTANTALMFVALALWFVRTSSLGFSVAVHTVWNFTIAVVLGLPLSGATSPWHLLPALAPRDTLWSGGAYGPEAGMAATLVWLALALVAAAPSSAFPTARG